MHICVKKEESHPALCVNPSRKVGFQTSVVLNVSPWLIHVPHMVCDKDI